jgi:hypothetical protein
VRVPSISSRRIAGRAGRLTLILTLAAIGGACATVQPWQRARLADACMTFEANSAVTAYAAHWQEAREGAAGGAGVQGGGCGCK